MNPDDADLRQRTERWFIHKGLPHLIEGYGATTGVMRRMIPALVALFFLETNLVFGERFAGWAQFGVWCGSAGILVAGAAVANRLRGRRLFQLPDRVGFVELGLFLVLPPVIVLLFGDSPAWGALIVLVLNVVAVYVIYLITSYGIVPMLRWAAVFMTRQIRQIVQLLARSLPLLLLFSLVIFLNAEMWQLAHDFVPVYYGIVVGMVLALSFVFLAIRIPLEVRSLAGFSSWQEVVDCASATDAPPASHPGFLATAHESPVPTAGAGEPVPLSAPLDRSARANVALLLFVSAMVRMLLVSLVVGVFFVILGLFTVRADTILQWTTQTELDPLATWRLFGGEMVLTWELLASAGVIAVVSALQFAVASLNDTAYREQFFNDVAAEIRGVLAVRAAYRRRLVT